MIILTMVFGKLGQNAIGRRALSSARLLRHASLAIFCDGTFGKRQQSREQLESDFQGLFSTSYRPGQQRHHQLR